MKMKMRLRLLVALLAVTALAVAVAPNGTVMEMVGHHAKAKHAKRVTTPTPMPTAIPTPVVPPGGSGGQSSINLSPWSLQLPTGSPGHPTTISSSQLVAGYSDQFFTPNSDGSISFVDPGTGCVTTANSLHCRTELSETNQWTSSAGTNTLSATLMVTNAAGLPVIGQIHDASSISVRPLIELFYTANGTISAGVEQCLAGGCEIRTTVGQVAVGTKFSYLIDYSQNKLSVSINGGAPTNLTSPILGQSGGYFKAGDYGQAATTSAVTFYSLQITHA